MLPLRTVEEEQGTMRDGGSEHPRDENFRDRVKDACIFPSWDRPSPHLEDLIVVCISSPPLHVSIP